MKVALLLGGCLLVTFGGCTALGKRPYWIPQVYQDFDHAEHDFSRARQHVEFDLKRASQEAEAELKRMYAALDYVKQKCASKGIDVIVQNGHSTGLAMQEKNGIQRFYEQIFNPASNKIEKIYYFRDLNDPDAALICGEIIP